MEVIRKIVDIDRVRAFIDIPKSFKHSKVEILILPAEDNQTKQTSDSFNPEDFYGISNIGNIDKAIREIRAEWDRI